MEVFSKGENILLFVKKLGKHRQRMLFKMHHETNFCKQKRFTVVVRFLVKMSLNCSTPLKLFIKRGCLQNVCGQHGVATYGYLGVKGF